MPWLLAPPSAGRLFVGILWASYPLVPYLGGQLKSIKFGKYVAGSGDGDHVGFFEETIEEETLEKYEEFLSEKVGTLDSKRRAVADSDDDFNEDYLEEATNDFQPGAYDHYQFGEKQYDIDEQRAIYDGNILEITVVCLQRGLFLAQYCSLYLAVRHQERDHGITMQELGETLRYDRAGAKVSVPLLQPSVWTKQPSRSTSMIHHCKQIHEHERFNCD
ncbi:hypothetical protein quinque_002258 [Culex quinquefasciatus]